MAQRSTHDAPQLPVLTDGLLGPMGGRRLPEGRPQREEGLLEQSWRILRHQWFIILQAIVVVAAAAAFLSASQADKYTAGASILFRSGAERLLGDDATITDPTRQAATNERLLKLGVVAEGAARSLDGALTPAQIAEAVSIVSTPDADIISVEATTEDPNLSARVATAYGNAFITFRKDSARRRLQEAIRLAEAARDALPAEQRNTEEGLALRDRINELETAESLQTGGAELVQVARPPSAPSSPKPVRDGILGAILGAILGFTIAGIRDRWGREIKDLDDFEKVSSEPVLGVIPQSRNLARGRLPLRGPEVEAFRVLRGSLRYVGVDRELRSVLIASARPAEGKSMTARRLAETMAAMGDRVVLVDADLHPHKDTALGVSFPTGGLADVLTGADLDDVLVEIPVDTGSGDGERRLAVVPSGSPPMNPSELLESDRMSDLMEELHERFDMVIVDSPPLGLLSDALPLVRQVSGILVVCALGKTTRDDLVRLSRRMQMLGGAVLGVVVNFARPSDQSTSYFSNQRA